MHRNTLMLLLFGAIFSGWIGLVMVVEGDERKQDVAPQPTISFRPRTPPKSDVIWEYKTICVQGPFANAANTLNEYGKKGWEVIDWEDTGFKHYLLKRQVPK